MPELGKPLPERAADITGADDRDRVSEGRLPAAECEQEEGGDCG
jgi:hypothetical protein